MKKIEKTIESNFSYDWHDVGGDNMYGGVVIECSCGCKTEFGVVYPYESILKCRCCGKKYKIRFKEWLEEI